MAEPRASAPGVYPGEPAGLRVRETAPKRPEAHQGPAGRRPDHAGSPEEQRTQQERDCPAEEPGIRRQNIISSLSLPLPVVLESLGRKVTGKWGEAGLLRVSVCCRHDCQAQGGEDGPAPATPS